MGVHSKLRKDKHGDVIALPPNDSFIEGRDDTDMSAMDLEINQEIPIDDPSQVVLHKEMFIDITN